MEALQNTSSPCSPRVERRTSAATKKRILDAAESLFGELGYSGTSMRAIADAAEVNLAATNYHFGSKEELLNSTFNRRVAPITQAQIERLDAIEHKKKKLIVKDIVHAFLDPVTFGNTINPLPKLMTRMITEPKSISLPFFRHAFEQNNKRFTQALSKALPAHSTENISWRFHFMIGAMVHFLNFETPMGYPVNGSTDSNNAEEGKEQLIKFVVAGICQ